MEPTVPCTVTGTVIVGGEVTPSQVNVTVAGTVAMDRNQALEDWEVQAGFVLCCQARPMSERVELSYDEK